MKATLLILSSFLLCGCSLLSQAQSNALASLQELLASGVITQDQFDTLVDALTGGGVGQMVGGAIGGVLAFLGIKSPALVGRIMQALSHKASAVTKTEEKKG